MLQGRRSRGQVLASISISMPTRRAIRRRAPCSTSPRPCSRPAYTGKVMAGHCCVLTVQDERTVKTDHRQDGRGRHRYRLAADVQHLPAGSRERQRRRPHPDPARRDPAQRVQGGRRRQSPSPRTIRATRSMPMAISTASKCSARARGSSISTTRRTRRGTGCAPSARPPPRMRAWCCKAVIEPGAPADLVLFRARTWTELNSRPQMDRIVLRSGRAIDTTLPDYRELDDLME